MPTELLERPTLRAYGPPGGPKTGDVTEPEDEQTEDDAEEK